MSKRKVLQFCARLQGRATMRQAAAEAEFTEQELDALIEAMSIVLDRRDDILAADGGIDTEKLAVIREVIQPLERKMDVLVEALTVMNETQRHIGESLGTIHAILSRATIRSTRLAPVKDTKVN